MCGRCASGARQYKDLDIWFRLELPNQSEGMGREHVYTLMMRSPFRHPRTDSS